MEVLGHDILSGDNLMIIDLWLLIVTVYVLNFWMRKEHGGSNCWL